MFAGLFFFVRLDCNNIAAILVGERRCGVRVTTGWCEVDTAHRDTQIRQFITKARMSGKIALIIRTLYALSCFCLHNLKGQGSFCLQIWCKTWNTYSMWIANDDAPPLCPTIQGMPVMNKLVILLRATAGDFHHLRCNLLGIRQTENPRQDPVFIWSLLKMSSVVTAGFFGGG